jgi:hypothetical protein
MGGLGGAVEGLDRIEFTIEHVQHRDVLKRNGLRAPGRPRGELHQRDAFIVGEGIGERTQPARVEVGRGTELSEGAFHLGQRTPGVARAVHAPGAPHPEERRDELGTVRELHGDGLSGHNPEGMEFSCGRVGSSGQLVATNGGTVAMHSNVRCCVEELGELHAGASCRSQRRRFASTNTSRSFVATNSASS